MTLDAESRPWTRTSAPGGFPWLQEGEGEEGPGSDLSPTRAPSSQLVSLASEVQDLHLAQRKEMATGFSKGPSLGLLPDVPSLMETLSYSYCYVGIMTGECGCVPSPASLHLVTTACPHSPPGLWCLFCDPASVPTSAPFFFFFKYLFIFERERLSASGRGAEREGGTESEAGSGLRAVSTELEVGLKLTNWEIMT